VRARVCALLACAYAGVFCVTEFAKRHPDWMLGLFCLSISLVCGACCYGLKFYNRIAATVLLIVSIAAFLYCVFTFEFPFWNLVSVVFVLIFVRSATCYAIIKSCQSS
jgi:predicted membrane protein